MKNLLKNKTLGLYLLMLFGSVFFVSCLKYGAESKDVKLNEFELVGDGNNNDSTYFSFKIVNSSVHELKKPYLKMVVKDTSDKILFNTLFSDNENLPNIPAKSTYYHYFYKGGFELSDEVGKIKVKLDWMNSKDKKSFIRKVYY